MTEVISTSIEIRILEDFEEKRVRGERWENEYGCLHVEKCNKEYYCDSSQYKIEVHKENNVVYFKIVPKYYQLPCGYQYWNYYDGCVHGNHLEWRRILKV